jgi:ComF family protein
MTRIINQLFHSTVEHLAYILFPPRCPSCEKLLHLNRTWCTNCYTQFLFTTSQNTCPTCSATLAPYQTINHKGKCPNCPKSTPIHAICRLGSYESALANTIANFKYRGNLSNGNLLGDKLGSLLTEQSWISDIDAFCPIPIHWIRHHKRGFNQSQILADRVALHVSRPVINLLNRTLPTPHQVGLSAQTRHENLKNAFKLRSHWPIQGSTICLIDDVMTTGSTLTEAANTLKRAGASKIYAAILAKAPLPT